MNLILKTIKDVEKGKYIPAGPFPEESFKFASFEFAYKRTNDYVRHILDNMPLKNDRRYTVVDIKVHDLKKGEYPALKHWHCDCVRNPFDERREEHNHIYLCGEGCETLFLLGDYEWNGDWKILDNAEGVAIEPNYIYSYGRAIHRARAAWKDCKRLLVRVTESDSVGPTNKKFEVRKYK